MYTLSSYDWQVEIHDDAWQKGRYRAELQAELACDPYDVDIALEQLDYRIVDADQWGRSYFHGKNAHLTVELDEFAKPLDSVRLILRQSNLNEEEIPSTEEELELTYAKIASMCPSAANESDHVAFWLSPEYGEKVSYPAVEDPEIGIDIKSLYKYP